MPESPKESRGAVFFLSIAGTLILPVVLFLAAIIDFGSDSAGNAIASAAFLIIVAPTLLALCTVAINALAKRKGLQPSKFLRITRVLPWAGGVCILILYSIIASHGMITYLHVANESQSEVRNVRIKGLKKPLQLQHIGPTHGTGIGSDWGKLPANLQIRWVDSSGTPAHQSLAIPKPKPRLKDINLHLILNDSGKWLNELRAK